jgi:hypothetical protein
MINEDLGYYISNGIKFSSKVDACLYGKTVNKPVEWIFHNDLFSKFPWNIEPTETLDQLYDKRSRELREKYDYIILSFSGGSDTNNILESFIRQGLHIDEIVTNHITDATKSTTVLDPTITSAWNFAAEHNLQAVPRLKYISEKCPRTKITVLDVSQVVLNSMNVFDDVDWVLHRNDHLSIGQLFRYNYFHFKEMKNQFDKNLKIGLIVGVDKPKCVIRKDNKFCIYFPDGNVNITTINDFNDDYTNITTELFYWSKDTLPMLAKQAHTVKRFLEINPDFQQYFKTASFASVRTHQEKLLRKLMYTTWNESWFQVNKSTSWFNTEFDTWFKTNPNMTKELTNWQRGINYLAEKMPDYIQKDDKGRYDSLKLFKHEYPIGLMKRNFSKILL